MKAIQPLPFRDSRVLQSVTYYVYPTQYIKINSKESEVNAFATSIIFDNLISTYHSLHVCSHQALISARLAACHVPLVLIHSTMKFLRYDQVCMCMCVGACINVWLCVCICIGILTLTHNSCSWCRAITVIRCRLLTVSQLGFISHAEHIVQDNGCITFS